MNKLIALLLALVFAGFGYMTYMSGKPMPTIPDTLSKDRNLSEYSSDAGETAVSNNGSQVELRIKSTIQEIISMDPEFFAGIESNHSIESGLVEIKNRIGKLVEGSQLDIAADGSASEWQAKYDDVFAENSNLKEKLKNSENLNLEYANLQEEYHELVERIASIENTSSEKLEALRANYDLEISQYQSSNQDLQISVQESRNQAEQINQMLAEKERTLLAEREKFSQLNNDLAQLKASMDEQLGKRDGQIQQLKDSTASIRLGSDVAFGFGSTNLSEKGQTVLTQVTELIQSYPNYVISLEGHSDNVPISDERRAIFPSNWELSAARAASAARFLIGLGVDPTRLRVAGYGPNAPIASNDEELGRAKNRRLEILFSPKTEIRLAQ